MEWGSCKVARLEHGLSSIRERGTRHRSFNPPMTTLAAAATPAPHAGAQESVLDDPLEQQRFTRWSTDGEGRRTADSTLRLSGMYCAACAGTIERALMAVDGVGVATVSAAGQRAADGLDQA
jgi:hypothetical protein